MKHDEAVQISPVAHPAIKGVPLPYCLARRREGMDTLSGQSAFAGSRAISAAPTAGSINSDRGCIELPAPCNHLPNVERGEPLEELPFVEDNGVKALLRTTDINTNHDRSTRCSAHGQSILK